MNSYKTNKKENAIYWDKIDTIIEQAVCEIANFSDVILDKTILSDIIGDGIVADARELIIDYLESKGGNFPYINENM